MYNISICLIEYQNNLRDKNLFLLYKVRRLVVCVSVTRDDCALSLRIV